MREEDTVKSPSSDSENDPKNMDNANPKQPKKPQAKAPRKKNGRVSLKSLNDPNLSRNSILNPVRRGRPPVWLRPRDCTHNNREEHDRGLCYQCASNGINKKKRLINEAKEGEYREGDGEVSKKQQKRTTKLGSTYRPNSFRHYPPGTTDFKRGYYIQQNPTGTL